MAFKIAAKGAPMPPQGGQSQVDPEMLAQLMAQQGGGQGAPGGPPPDPGAGAEPPAEESQETPDDESAEQDDSSQQGGPVDPQIAGYMGPDQGPFMCGNCVYFDNGTCKIVSGEIDQMGCCNLFTSAGAANGEGDQEQPTEEPPPDEEQPPQG